MINQPSSHWRRLNRERTFIRSNIVNPYLVAKRTALAKAFPLDGEGGSRRLTDEVFGCDYCKPYLKQKSRLYEGDFLSLFSFLFLFGGLHEVGKEGVLQFLEKLRCFSTDGFAVYFTDRKAE